MPSDTYILPAPKVTRWLDLAKGVERALAQLHVLPGPTARDGLLLCTDLFRLHAIHVRHPSLAALDFRLPPGVYTISPLTSDSGAATGWRLTPAPDDVTSPRFQQFQPFFPFHPPGPDPDPASQPLAIQDWPVLSRTAVKGLAKADIMAYFRLERTAGLFTFHGFLPRRWAAGPDMVRLNPLHVTEALAQPRYTAPPRMAYPTAVMHPDRPTVRLGEWLAFSLLPNIQIPPWMARRHTS